MKTLHLRIHGRVQGVWFRESMRQEAEKLGVTGWVRNTADGAVEAMLQGDDAAVATLIEWCRKGPPLAHVTRIDQSDATGEFTGFAKLPAY